MKKENEKAKRTTRRSFLASTAAGTGMLLAGEAAAQNNAAPAIVKNPGDQLNIALIGVGEEGRALMDAMLKIPGIRFQAVCDIWEKWSLKRAAGMLKKLGHPVNAYIDYRELLDKEKGLDAAVIATPDFVHAEHSIACMQAGLHVYCEKEMSNDLDLARQMVIASRENKKLLQIGHQRRSNPRYHHAVNRVLHEQKLLGRLTQSYAQWNRAKSEDLGWPEPYPIPPEILDQYGYESMHHFRNWRWYKKYGGGPIVDLGSHQIDIFSWVYGAMPKSVIASGGIDFYKHHEWYDNVMAIFEYDSTNDGVTRALYQVLTTTSKGGYYESFSGENGTLVISEYPPYGDHVLKEKGHKWERYAKEGLILEEKDTATPTTKSRDIVADVRITPPMGAWPLPVILNKSAHQPHLENFFDAIRLGVALNCPGEIGYETAVAVLKVNDAVEVGRKIEFNPEEFEV